MTNLSELTMTCILLAAQLSRTVILIFVIALFTVTFISSAIITYKIRKKKFSEKSEQNDKYKNPE